MQHPHPRRFLPRLGVSALAIATMFAGAACGAATTGSPARLDGAAQVSTAGHATASVRRQLRELEQSYRGRIGAFAIDTGTGRSFSYRAHERFPSNSSFKAILCGAILHKARTSDPGLMQRTLHWSKDDVVDWSPITGTPENIENGMNPAQLCRAAITVSDNTAANVLLGQIGGPKGMTRCYRSLGDPVGRLDRHEPELNDWHPGERRDTIMPAFMAADLRKITLGPALVPQDRERLIGWLKAGTTGGKRIRAGVPDTWTVGDKTGTGGAYGTASDIAVAWRPSGAPVVMAVYINRPAEDAGVDDGVIAAAASILADGLGA